MRGAGADGLVVASKPGNAGGGKGPDTLAEEARPTSDEEEPVSEAKPLGVRPEVGV